MQNYNKWNWKGSKQLLENIVEFNDKSRSRTKEGKVQKINTFESVAAPYEGRKLILNTIKMGYLR